VLDSVLGKLARQQDANVLVGFDKADDAGVYLVAPNLALVQTVDFFTPIVDDPYTFGQIAAVNALSDVYAMGGKPFSALAMVCFPEKGDIEILEQILAGGLSKMVEAGCTVIGGHSIRDPEIKFGYAVTGTIDPNRIMANSGARVGDRLILTKPLGTGVISTAIKKGEAPPEWIAAASDSMTTLNRRASEIALQYDIHGMTDITGFGLIGHSRELALASGVSLEIDSREIPILSGALESIHAGFIPGGLNANRDFAECVVEGKENVSDDLWTLLFDPQTAGGLLISVNASECENLVRELRSAGIRAANIGQVLSEGKPLIRVI
jgi:selenide, water dikinase